MELEQMAQNAPKAVALLKAMANERRLFILCYLLQEEMSVGMMSEKLQLSQSALSQHLAWLRRDGLVATRKEAQTVYYRLKSKEVRAMIQLLHSMYCGAPAAETEIQPATNGHDARD